MPRSYDRQNVVNRVELQPRSGERSYDSLFFSDLADFSDFFRKILRPANNSPARHEQLLMDSKALRGRVDRRVGHGTLVLMRITSF